MTTLIVIVTLVMVCAVCVLAAMMITPDGPAALHPHKTDRWKIEEERDRRL